MIEVILVTGFLGSGKTTLLNRMIAARALGDDLGRPGKLALIVNELGEVGIDGELLPADLTRQIELPGGCICCVLNEDLDRTILGLLESSPEIATIVIETTGVAEPLPIAWTFLREPLSTWVRLAAVVTLVDTTGFVAARSLSPAVDAQVAYADVVVLSKTDLASPEQIAATREAVAALAPRAPVVTGTPEEIVDWLADAIADPEVVEGKPEIGHGHGHGHGIDSVWVPVDSEVDLEELGDALAELPAAYVRVKGIVPVDGGWAVVHRVGLRVSSEPLARAPADRQGRIVALGPGVARGPLAGCVERAVVSSTAETAP
jgi:G3E family GTPase